MCKHLTPYSNKPPPPTSPQQVSQPLPTPTPQTEAPQGSSDASNQKP